MSDPIAYLREHARQLDKNPMALAQECLRYGTASGPDLVALLATRGRLDLAGVVAVAEEFLHTGELLAPPEVTKAFRAPAVGALATVMVGREYRDEDFVTAATLHRFAYALGEHSRQAPNFMRLAVQTNLAAGEHEFVRALVEREDLDDDTRWMVRTELLAPRALGASFDPDAWAASLSEVFAASGAAPVALRGGPAGLFDQICVAAHVVPPKVAREDAPLVTVVMSVYAPDDSFETAVRSILDQTWTHLELLVVDDCSPAEFTARIDAAAGWDPRITVLRMAENGGTYQVRNLALQHARGDLVTFQDSDDWSHPERIARQANALLGDPGVIADHSHAVRLASDLTANSVGYRARRVGASSLMFRRKEVLERLGEFDPVRKGADTEFVGRLRAVFGPESVIDLPDVLSASQMTGDSLSRNDFAYGWHSPLRLMYREGAEEWHEQIAAGAVSGHLTAADPRPFPAPRGFLHRGQAPEIVSQVVFVSDWRRNVSRYQNAPRRARALVEAGLDVHLAHAQSQHHAYRGRKDSWSAVRAMRVAGEVSWVVWEEPRRATLTLVDQPELLMYPRSSRDVRLRTDRLVVIAGSAPRSPGGETLVYDPAVVERHARDLFGADLQWLPADAAIADELRTAGALGTILPPRPIDVVDLPDPPREGPLGSRLTIGTAGVDGSRRERPDPADVLAALPPDRRWDVRVHDTTGAVASILDEPPAHWDVTDEGTVEDFLGSLDVFVGITPRSWGAGIAWTTLQALARGCVVVLDPRHEALFGPCALYAEPADTAELLGALVFDPALLQRQQRLAAESARESFDAAGFAAHVRRIGSL